MRIAHSHTTPLHRLTGCISAQVKFQLDHIDKVRAEDHGDMPVLQLKQDWIGEQPHPFQNKVGPEKITSNLRQDRFLTSIKSEKSASQESLGEIPHKTVADTKSHTYTHSHTLSHTHNAHTHTHTHTHTTHIHNQHSKHARCQSPCRTHTWKTRKTS
jgi:hypothetical protein